MTKRNDLLSRPLAVLLAALLLLGTVAPALAAGSTSSFEGDTIAIRTVDDLLELSRRCALDTWSQGKTVVLQANLSLLNVDFSPIPSFGGTFDGGGHIISGLSISSGDYPAGLFGIVQKDGKIKSLTVTGEVVPSGDANTVGGLVGINYGQLDQCAFWGLVRGKDTVGGIAGLNDVSGQLVNCSFRGVVNGEHYVGGIAGRNSGSLVRCVNSGSINTTEIDVESSLQDLDLSLGNFNTTENIPVGTDIGGVAGFSSGLLQSCENTGDVGYAHMGYNMGGIAGRQSGLLDGCVSTGTVRGRKDVGGVVGQMEPQVTLKYGEATLSDLWDELDVLQSLMDQTLTHAEGTSDALSLRMDALTASVGTTKAAASDLSHAMTDWANGNIDQVNDASARLSWLLDQLIPVSEQMSDSLDELDTAIGHFSDALEDTDDMIVWSTDASSDLRAALVNLRNASAHAGNAMTHFQNALDALEASLGDPDTAQSALEDLADAMADLSGAIAEIADALSGIDGLPIPDDVMDTLRTQLGVVSDACGRVSGALQALAGNLDLGQLGTALTELKSASSELAQANVSLGLAMGNLIDALDDLKQAGSSASKALDHLIDGFKSSRSALSQMNEALRQGTDAFRELSEKPTIEFTPVGSDLTARGDALDDALDNVLDQISNLNDTMASSSDTLLADLRAINRQGGVIVNLLRALSDNANTDGDDLLEDISDQVLTEDRTSGLISNARNSGTVEGDINVAGIVGSIAIEYDFDPEDDLSGGENRTLSSRCQLVAVVRSSTNAGSVTGKKDYAGGIVGRMDVGAAYLCESYGSVSSTDGSYVGGIAGQTHSVVRKCFSKCSLSGGSYVGGIIGSGTEDSRVEQCGSLVRITDCEQYGGAVSGSEDGAFAGNLFVSDELAGLGRVSYAGKAEPVSYAQLLETADLPAPFRYFTLTFQADGAPLKTKIFNYGDSFDASIYPEAPQKEGCYAQWDIQELTDLRFDTVVEAVYHPYITALSSQDDRAGGRAILYVEGDFQDGDTLELAPLSDMPGVSDLPDTPLFRTRHLAECWTVRLPDDGAPVHTFRYLPDEDSSVRLYIRLDGGRWSRVTTEELGRYLSFTAAGTQLDLAVFTIHLVWWVWLVIAAVALIPLTLFGRKLAARAGRHRAAKKAEKQTKKAKNR